MATTLGLALVVGGTWYAVGTMKELTDGLGGGTGSTALPYGDTVGLTEPLKDGDCVDVTWTDGVTRTKSVFHFPHSFALLELFKIVGGKIAGVEAVFITVPYNMPSPWEA